MKRIIPILVLCCVALLSPCKLSAQVTATILEQELTPSVPDVDNNRVYASVSYTIKVEGAEGHSLRVEIPWTDMKNNPVYFDIDNGETALNTQTYYLNSATDTIEGWCGPYHDSFWLKPGTHKLNGTIKLFDETLGKYIDLKGAKKHTLSIKSTKKAQGAVFTKHVIEHNKYVGNSKVMYVWYSFETSWLKGKEIKTDVTLYKSNGSVISQNNGKPEKVIGTVTSTYTFTSFSDRWAYFPYAGMKLPKGSTNCYALIRLYDAKTGKVLATSPKLTFIVNK